MTAISPLLLTTSYTGGARGGRRGGGSLGENAGALAFLAMSVCRDKPDITRKDSTREGSIQRVGISSTDDLFTEERRRRAEASKHQLLLSRGYDLENDEMMRARESLQIYEQYRGCDEWSFTNSTMDGCRKGGKRNSGIVFRKSEGESAASDRAGPGGLGWSARSKRS